MWKSKLLDECGIVRLSELGWFSSVLMSNYWNIGGRKKSYVLIDFKLGNNKVRMSSNIRNGTKLNYIKVIACENRSSRTRCWKTMHFRSSLVARLIFWKLVLPSALEKKIKIYLYRFPAKSMERKNSVLPFTRNTLYSDDTRRPGRFDRDHKTRVHVYKHNY